MWKKPPFFSPTQAIPDEPITEDLRKLVGGSPE